MTEVIDSAININKTYMYQECTMKVAATLGRNALGVPWELKSTTGQKIEGSNLSDHLESSNYPSQINSIQNVHKPNSQVIATNPCSPK